MLGIQSSREKCIVKEAIIFLQLRVDHQVLSACDGTGSSRWR